MRKIQVIFLLSSLLFTTQLTAQYVSLVENKGEIGVSAGQSFYRGDIASDQMFSKPSFGAYYKKQLNDYVGIRFNYEYISLGANDLQSSNFYEFKRGLNFSRVSHDASVMGEFYFLRFISGNKRYRCTPYLGFGVGAWKSISGSTNIDTPSTQRTILFPINLGFKYNVFGHWNLFGEVTYRFTNSDKIDYFSDQDFHVPGGTQLKLQGSNSGMDQYVSSKLGISYNLFTVYGLEEKKDTRGRKWLFFRKNEHAPEKSNKKGLFGFLKRK
jgi:hypothetical protein